MLSSRRFGWCVAVLALTNSAGCGTSRGDDSVPPNDSAAVSERSPETNAVGSSGEGDTNVSKAEPPSESARASVPPLRADVSTEPAVGDSNSLIEQVVRYRAVGNEGGMLACLAPCTEPSKLLDPPTVLQAEVEARARSMPAPDPDAVAQILEYRRHPKVIEIHFCINQRGATAEISGSTRREEKPWVALYEETVQRWRFAPFEEQGVPIPVCTNWTFLCPTR